jgi:hypothetical protein
MAHITENTSVLDSAIVGMKIGYRHVEIKRYNGEVSTFNFTKDEPDMNETDPSSKNFVNGKNRYMFVDSINDFVDPIELDIAKLPDGEAFVRRGDRWVRIARDMIDISTSIDIGDWVEGRIYSAGSVVRDRGLIFLAKKESFLRPSAIGSTWRAVTEYDMFKKRCELDSPKLSGYFDVSGPMFMKKTIVLDTKDKILNWFNNSDVDISGLFTEDAKGMYLMNKHATENEINLWHTISTNNFKITGIEIDGTIMSLSSAGSITMEVGDLKCAIIDNYSDIDGALMETDITDVSDNSTYDYYSIFGNDKDFSLANREVRINDNYSKININYRYSTLNLSRHRIKKITIYCMEVQ